MSDTVSPVEISLIVIVKHVCIVHTLNGGRQLLQEPQKRTIKITNLH